MSKNENEGEDRSSEYSKNESRGNARNERMKVRMKWIEGLIH